MARLQINLGAIRHNLQCLRAACAPGCRVMLVCKSDFYGLGLDVAARIEDQVDGFAVGSLNEARRLLAITRGHEVVVLYPPMLRSDLCELLDACRAEPLLVPAIVPTPEHADCLRDAGRASGRLLPCYVLWPQPGDRFWRPGKDARETFAEILRPAWLDVRGVFTHIAEAHSLHDAAVAERIAAFRQEMSGVLGADGCKGDRHPFLNSEKGASPHCSPLCNSLRRALCLSVADSHLAGRGLGTDLGFCRVGLFPLGVVSAGAVNARGLRQALRLTARVVNGYSLPAAGRVGYGEKPIPVGEAVSILDIGFAQGLPFDFFRHCRASAGGRTYAFLDTPWMEYSGILTGPEPLPPGTEVELFGEALPVAAQGELAGVPAEDLFCHLGRAKREVRE